MPVEVICIDHVFIPVRDLAAAEAFYDKVMPILGFRKGPVSDKVSPRARYDNRHLSYWVVLREDPGARRNRAPPRGLRPTCAFAW